MRTEVSGGKGTLLPEFCYDGVGRPKSVSSVTPWGLYSVGGLWNYEIILNVHFQVVSIFKRFSFLDTKFRSQTEDLLPMLENYHLDDIRRHLSIQIA